MQSLSIHNNNRSCTTPWPIIRNLNSHEPSCHFTNNADGDISFRNLNGTLTRKGSPTVFWCFPASMKATIMPNRLCSLEAGTIVGKKKPWVGLSSSQLIALSCIRSFSGLFLLCPVLNYNSSKAYVLSPVLFLHLFEIKIF